jgi:hypothetical protein
VPRTLVVSLLGLACLTACYRLLGETAELLEEPPRSGREAVARALEPPALIRKSSPTLGILTTGLSSLRFVPGLDRADEDDERVLRFELPDGTVVGGLLVDQEDGEPGPEPLLIASFGFLQDRFGTEAAKFVDLYVGGTAHELPADVLLLDHPTSGIFAGNNESLSPGSYDDGRMWIEVARLVRRQVEPASVHLFGVSMSGQTVVHALIEDARLGLGLFDSGMAISIAPDFAVAPGRQFAAIDTGKGISNPWAAIAPEKGGPGDDLQVQAIRLLIDRQFVPGYRSVRPDLPDFQLASEAIPLAFWGGFEGRLDFLRRHGGPAWNADFSRADLPRYLATTRVAPLIDRVRTPLLMLSAEDDPAVPSAAFQEVATAAAENPWVLAYETGEGGHFGFDVPYGAGYLEELIELMIDPRIFAHWRGAGAADSPGSADRLSSLLPTGRPR